MAKCTCVRPMRRSSPLDWMACQLWGQTRMVRAEEVAFNFSSLRNKCTKTGGAATHPEAQTWA